METGISSLSKKLEADQAWFVSRFVCMTFPVSLITPTALSSFCWAVALTRAQRTCGLGPEEQGWGMGGGWRAFPVQGHCGERTGSANWMSNAGKL